MTCVPFTYTWIETGKVLIGSIPQQLEDQRQLVSMGIHAVCSLTRRDPTNYGFVPPDDLIFGHFPIPDGGIADEAIMMNAVRFIKNCYNSGFPVYVHCRGGIGRSGTILIAYYVLCRAMTVAQARDMVRIRRNYEGNATAADQGSPQREWIDALETKAVL